MFQGFRAVQDTLSSLSEVLASPTDGVEAGDSEDEADRGRDQGAGAAEGAGAQGARAPCWAPARACVMRARSP